MSPLWAEHPAAVHMAARRPGSASGPRAPCSAGRRLLLAGVEIGFVGGVVVLAQLGLAGRDCSRCPRSGRGRAGRERQRRQQKQQPGGLSLWIRGRQGVRRGTTAGRAPHGPWGRARRSQFCGILGSGGDTGEYSIRVTYSLSEFSACKGSSTGSGDLARGLVRRYFSARKWHGQRLDGGTVRW